MPVINQSRQRRRLAVGLLAASTVVGLLVAVLSVSTVSLFPPKLQRAQLQIGGATSRVLLDMPHSRLSDRLANSDYFGSLRTRGALLARVMVSPPAVEHIGRRAGVDPNQIAAVAPVTASVPSVLTEPGSEQRAQEIVRARAPYRVEALARIDAPVIEIYTQAPSPAAAERLADAAIAGLRDELRDLAVRAHKDPANQVRLEQLGSARGGVINKGAGLKIAFMSFFVAFALAFVLLLAVARLVARRQPAAARAPRPAPAAPAGSGATVTAMAPSPLVGGPRVPLGAGSAGAIALAPARARLTARGLATYGGDWPRTTRVLPWMLAAFIAVLWLVPIDSIQLTVSLPVDLKFDRLVLPIVAVTWVLALAAGGLGAPRLRVTWVHVAVGAFVAIAFLSVLFDARGLNHSLELDTSVKKLPLLLSYLTLFIMLASVVRRREVRPFLTYTLVLAVVCAVGMLYEYRTEYNVFFEWSSKVLPGFFKVTFFQSGYDFGGRRTTHGPAVHGLVAVAMLSMALPIAIVRIMESERPRQRLLYGLAAVILLAAMFATQRKTALLAPVSVFVTLGYFRRRELLKMAPLGVVGIILVLIVSPGTVAPVIDQFKPTALGANTVNDRASDYDAIRPDVYTHLALGRGYGSYQPVGHRILDSEVLLRIVETGILGLVAFILVGVSVVASTRSSIASRHPTRGPPALACAAAAVVFLVTATLFDTMSYPQVPYIFLCFAAFAAALAKSPDGDDDDDAEAEAAPAGRGA